MNFVFPSQERVLVVEKIQARGESWWLKQSKLGKSLGGCNPYFEIFFLVDLQILERRFLGGGRKEIS